MEWGLSSPKMGTFSCSATCAPCTLALASLSCSSRRLRRRCIESVYAPPHLVHCWPLGRLQLAFGPLMPRMWVLLVGQSRRRVWMWQLRLRSTAGRRSTGMRPPPVDRRLVHGRHPHVCARTASCGTCRELMREPSWRRCPSFWAAQPLVGSLRRSFVLGLGLVSAAPSVLTRGPLGPAPTLACAQTDCASRNLQHPCSSG